MKFYCIPTCSTCKKARDFLDSLAISYEEINLKEETPTAEILIVMSKANGISLDKFFNTSGEVYRKLELKDRLRDMKDEEKAELLSENGMLIRRPLLIDQDNVLIGFKQAEWDSYFSEM